MLGLLISHGNDSTLHRLMPVDVLWQKLMLERQHTEDRLDTARGTGGMTRERLR